MSEATNILDLPTEPIGGGNINNNITMTTQESSSPPGPVRPAAPAVYPARPAFHRSGCARKHQPAGRQFIAKTV